MFPKPADPSLVDEVVKRMADVLTQASGFRSITPSVDALIAPRCDGRRVRPHRGVGLLSHGRAGHCGQRSPPSPWAAWSVAASMSAKVAVSILSISGPVNRPSGPPLGTYR